MCGTTSTPAASTGAGAFTVSSCVGTPTVVLSSEVALKTSTRTISPEDGGGKDAGRGNDRQKLRVPNVRFLPPRDH
jgi:hypothetical protein